MSEREDHIYFTQRAATERAIANRSEDNAVALAHLRLADEYERRAALLSKPAGPLDAAYSL